MAADPRKAGTRNSSITRVRPVVSALLEQAPAPSGWLIKLLELRPAGQRILADIPGDPGDIAPSFLRTREVTEPPLLPVDLAVCFEYCVPPSAAFLR